MKKIEKIEIGNREKGFLMKDIHESETTILAEKINEIIDYLNSKREDKK